RTRLASLLPAPSRVRSAQLRDVPTLLADFRESACWIYGRSAESSVPHTRGETSEGNDVAALQAHAQRVGGGCSERGESARSAVRPLSRNQLWLRPRPAGGRRSRFRRGRY